MNPTIHHHGGATTVTGSCHRWHRAGYGSVLIDCGGFQGRDAQAPEAQAGLAALPVEDLRAVVLTHVHFDHVGRLPELLAAGYAGPILCTQASARLLPEVLGDTLRVGFTRDRQLIQRVVERVQSLLVPLRWGEPWRDGPVTVRLGRAGHILGSAWVQVDDAGTGHRTVFSGDLGPAGHPFLRPGTVPHHADTLVLESTYGDRLHGDRNRRLSALRAAVDAIQRDRGVLVIPAFALGRTQAVLADLAALREAGQLHRNLPVYADAPLAGRFTALYRQLSHHWHREARAAVRGGRHPLRFPGLHTVADHADHRALVRRLPAEGGPAVVLSGSGMLTGGRVLAHLHALLGDPAHRVLFTGFQAPGTPGRALQQAAPGASVELDGQSVRVAATVETAPGYSAHADQAGLLRFVRRMKRWPSTVHLVHGDDAARAALGEALTAMYARRGKEVRVAGLEPVQPEGLIRVLDDLEDLEEESPDVDADSALQ